MHLLSLQILFDVMKHLKGNDHFKLIQYLKNMEEKMKILSSTKKAITFLFTGIMAATVVSLPMAVNAANPISMTVTSAKGAAGTDVVVSVNVTADSKLSAATFLLKYDNTKLTVKSSVAGKASEGGLASINPKFDVTGNISTINCSFIHSTGITASGSIMDVTFTIKSGWNGSTPLTLTISDFVDSSYKALTYSIKNGSVTVTEATSVKTTTAASTTKDSGTAKTTLPEKTTEAANTTNTSATVVNATTTAVEDTETEMTVDTDVSTSLSNDESTVKEDNKAENDQNSSMNKAIIIIIAVSAFAIIAAFAAFIIRKKK